MADHPLLFFPSPEITGRQPPRGGGGPSHLRYPSARRQGDRLNPEFQRLADVVRSRNLELRNNMVGVLPDQALVLETIGTVDDFVDAVRQVNGLEWLAEADLSDIQPDDDFRDERDDRSLRGRLFW